MEFTIEYTGSSEQKTLIYREDEFSFDMEPWIPGLDFEIAINTLTLTIIDGKVTQFNGFCGLNRTMKANYTVPQSQKGELRVLHPERYWDKSGTHGINKEDWPVYVNIQTGWVCIGNPERKGNAVEFINNCVAVIDDGREFISLWLKPEKLPDI
ncbi:MAG: hypothetical protein LBK94_10040 [Prevotellaceae bacterium]|jgi:hypothetical protein|nr:hypothetical protein [Prevotellaceae bacterium]